MTIKSSIQRGFVDFVLAGVAGIMATYAMGMSLFAPQMAFIFFAAILFGTLFSYGIFRRIEGSAFEPFAVYLYIAGMVAAPFISRAVNSYLPGGGFPPELMGSAAPIVWMILIGSFLAWTDGTLAFQAVPCIAVFGLVGAFNTFPGATVTFFVFMLCAAGLYARSHQRSMLRRATLSGYRHLDALRYGPWRWVAGPEWALISAAAVIVLSLIGAPILQESVRGVSGVVRITPPRAPLPPPSAAPGPTLEGQRVGRGPLGNLQRTEVFRAELPEGRLLRTTTFARYQDGAWHRVQFTDINPRDTPARLPFLDLKDVERNFTRENFAIRFVAYPDAILPSPAPVLEIRDRYVERRGVDGTLRLSEYPPIGHVFRGIFASIKSGLVPKNAPTVDNQAAREYRNTAAIPPRVIEWAREVSREGATDYEKAQLIKKAIERRVRYNLNAEAAPSRVDPVEWFLFGPINEGYCDLFASAMVLGARSIGIPARYAIGYLASDNERQSDGWISVRRSDYHAWAELYFEGFGWVAFDATEGAAAVPGGERGGSWGAPPIWDQPWFPWVVNGLIALAGAAGLAVLIRSGRRNGAAKDRHLEAVGEAYAQFVRSLEFLTGRTKSIHQTPDEFFKLVLGDLGPAQERASAIHRRFIDAFYGPDPVDETLAEGLKLDTAAFRRDYKPVRRRGVSFDES